jgi:hypothetical protein
VCPARRKERQAKLEREAKGESGRSALDRFAKPKQ